MSQLRLLMGASLATLAVACGSTTGASSTGTPDTSPDMPELIAGFDPPPPSPGQKVYVSPVLPAIAPGADVTLCSYLDAHFTQSTDVTGFDVYQSKGGHHVILYATMTPKPVGTHECTDADMLTSSFVAAGGQENGAAEIFKKVPDGLAFRFPAGAQLMIQTHWINASSEMLPAGQAIAYLTEGPEDKSRQVLDLVNVVNTQFSIPAHQKVTSTTTCPIARDVTLFSLDGHQHEWGQHVDIELLDGMQSTMLYSHNWQPEFQSAPPINQYSVGQPLLFKAGQSVRVTCTWQNPTDKDIAFPREMCVGSGFYFPGKGQIDCVDGMWSESN